MKTSNPLEFVSELIKFSPRQGRNETKAAKFIMDTLDRYGIPYALHKFQTTIPVFTKELLTADGKKISCKGASLVSGSVEGKEQIVSSLVFSDAFIKEPNINFNPKSDYISLASIYFAPALAVSRKDLIKILRAKRLTGEVRVKPYRHQSLNILIGNIKNPKTVVFAHYDSIETGATDNASGVGVMIQAVLSYPETFTTTLYIFSGNEELSFDYPTYWGHGFRAFEKEHFSVLEQCKKILVVDSLGNGKTIVSQDEKIMHLAFPVGNIKEWKDKIFLLYGDLGKLMTVYHAKGDTIHQLKITYLKEAVRTLMKGLC